MDVFGEIFDLMWSEFQRLWDLALSTDDFYRLPRLSRAVAILGNVAFISLCFALPIKGCYFLYQRYLEVPTVSQIEFTHLRVVGSPTLGGQGVKTISPAAILMRPAPPTTPLGTLWNFVKGNPRLWMGDLLAAMVLALALAFTARMIFLFKKWVKPLSIMAVVGSFKVGVTVKELLLTRDYGEFLKYVHDFPSRVF